jgi:hypothetical protein
MLALAATMVLLLAATAPAQQSKNPSEVEWVPISTPERIYRPWKPYDLSFIMEVGGQAAAVDGNRDVYNSQQNYGDGFKVFQFDLRALGQEGAFFNELYLKGGGWGVNEPYSWTRFGFRKDRIVDFKGSFRQSQYDWYVPGFARDQHVNHTDRRLQNYQMTIFPRRQFRVKTGYRRNSSFGPSLTTLDFARGEFPLEEPILQTTDEYTVGVEGNLGRWLVVGEYGYRYFTNDRFLTIFDNPDTIPANDAADSASLTQFVRLNPSRGKIPFFRANVVGRPHRTLEVNLRAVYSRARSDFTRLEFRDGTSYSQGPAVPSVTTTANYDAFGQITRPMTNLDGNLTWRPIREFTFTNNFQYRGYNIAGFQDEDRLITCGAVSGSCSAGDFNFFWNTLFDLNAFSNRTEARYDINDWFAVRGGFTYLQREFRFDEFEQETDAGIVVATDTHREELDFLNRSYLAGVILKPNRRAQFFFDLEKGDNTRVFTRLSPAEIDRFRLRGRFEPWDGVRFNASWFLFDNSNPNLPTAANPAGRHDTENRGFSVDVQYAPTNRGYINGGFSRNDFQAISDVMVPGFGPAAFRGGTTFYQLDDIYYYFDVGGRVFGDLYVDAGYRLLDTSGTMPPSDPVQTCVPNVPASCDNTGGLDPLLVFDGGLKYHQPHVSLRYEFSDTASWKVGWRTYRYNQEGGAFSDYKAHIVTTSMVFNF